MEAALAPEQIAEVAKGNVQSIASEPIPTNSESDEDMPLSQRALKVQKAPAVNGNAKRQRVNYKDSSDSEDDMPLKDKIVPPRAAALQGSKRKPESRSDPAHDKKRRKTQSQPANGASTAARKKPGPQSGEKRWSKLCHSGVLFPPEYEAHGIQMLYEGKPVDLTPEQEEVATMFAVMKETDYMKHERFLRNFWDAFKPILGKGHVIRDLKKCDFSPIYEHHMAEREKKKAMPKEEKVALKAQKDADEAKYKVALVDGRQEQVGNFRVEPPGLFRGRGEHPKMGKLKKRVYPRDITINIGKGEPIPEHPFPGQKWKEVRHDNTVTWLAYWKDPISQNSFKYVWLAANSTFKSEGDLAKYEKARKLKYHIDDIRAAYEKDWKSKDPRARQMGVALYFIDKLALRAGHEKEEDEADTVGCASLKLENVELLEPETIRFDFLGKDSIRYENEVKVERKVFQLVKEFSTHDAHGNKKKNRDAQLFDTMDAQDLNRRVKELMDDLSVKVFRTYNASITLNRLLYESISEGSYSVDQRKADYDRANKEVAILCNHQRAVNKAHAGQMEKMQGKMQSLMEELHDLQADLKAARKSEKAGSADALQSRVEKKKQQIEKMELQAKVKEDLKTVALGTSKINYLDPRITVAWCKRNEVPIEKIFNKSLLSKFHWSMDVEPEFSF
ncbi:hypothetical protein WJX74_009017 [Apatococcus lobatus]|uniref:DNA topoisomerase I n=1 Tax=Apatococcus lobatus TaxID=904363 RepID=A0AAW1SHM0_9CHLO